MQVQHSGFFKKRMEFEVAETPPGELDKHRLIIMTEHADYLGHIFERETLFPVKT